MPSGPHNRRPSCFADLCGDPDILCTEQIDVVPSVMLYLVAKGIIEVLVIISCISGVLSQGEMQRSCLENPSALGCGNSLMLIPSDEVGACKVC